MSNDPHRPTVLNVDDHDAARYVRSRLLTDAGCRVFEAGTGEEALLLIPTLRPALIVLDVRLPGPDGLAVCRAVKGDPATAHIMVLLVSAVKSAATDRAAGLDSGADAYLVEPIEPIELIATVKALLRLAERDADYRRMEQALRESDVRYAAIVDSAMDGIITIGEDQRIVLFNKAAENMFRCPAAEAVGSPVDRFIPERFRRDHERHVRQFGSGGTTSRAMGRLGSVRGLRADGEEFPIEASISSVHTDTGRLSTVILRDITARMQTEETLRASEQFLRRVLDNLFAFVGVMTPDGTLIEANRAPLDAAGIPATEVLGRKFWDCYWWNYSPEIQAQLKDAVEQALRGRIVRYDVPVRMAQGRLMWIDFQLAPLRDPAGRITHLIPSGMDISARREAEQRLGESESFHRQTLESIPGMVFTNRPDGSCDYVSQQWVDFTGVPAAEQLGSGWVQMLHPDDRERAMAAWRDAVEGRGRYDLEYRVRRRDGRYKWFKISGRPIRDEQGGIVRWFGTGMNVDDLKQTQEELHRWKDELELRVQERTRQLIDSQRRLRSLASELTVTEQRAQRKLAKDLHDYLAQLLVVGRLKTGRLKKEAGLPAKAETMAAELDTIFEQALTYTRTMIAELSPPSVQESGLPAALAWLAERMQKDGLWVEVQSDDRPTALSEEQAVLLFQSARELLMNVLKHAGVDRATVRLTVRESEEVRLSVEDRGKGLGPRALQRASEPGHLGLFAVRERMEAMGGRLEVASSPGEGTTATLVLPLGGKEAVSGKALGIALGNDSGTLSAGPQRSTLSDSKLQDAKVRVLLVDDHALVRQGIGTLLDTYTDVTVVGEAGDGLEAVAMTERHEPDVVVMDFTMPKMNGADATRRIKRSRPRTVVIGLSVTDQEHVRREMLAAGAVAFVSKDSAPDELYRVIMAAV
ncbi:PAS domain S-box protein [Nitrospira moscoviensis]|uniref:Oxygen sensor histidine kinase NreB n=1 Tax=Nitrospira moscoviensis TaxID=42253 RepID=A0A0K2GE79_NITMO|nr:PAS domain S-box protein [Nitrospira moscoviensis]ALA59169.1 conserved protein of unknown function, histidine kinase [Nitrospira moscoviensis]